MNMSLERRRISLRDEEEATGCFGMLCGCVQCECCEFADALDGLLTAPHKVEPKLFLANERTFMKWMHMAITISSVSSGVIAFAGKEQSWAVLYAMTLLPISLLIVIYAIFTFHRRSALIKTRRASRWDDPIGPVILTGALTITLTIQYLIHSGVYFGVLDVTKVKAAWQMMSPFS